MRDYILRRLVLLVPVLLLVSIIAFVLIRLVPGDVVDLQFAGAGATKEDIAQFRKELGLDKPIHLQYLDWFGGVLRGHLGNSLWTGKPVTYEIRRRVPVSVEIAVLVMLISIATGIPLGVVSACRQDSLLDYILRVLSVGAFSFPSFWLGTLLIVFPAIWFHWRPPIPYSAFFDDPLRNLQQVIFPALCISARVSATSMRMTRSQMLEVLRQDYIRTAWAKGLAERAVVFGHALKNALIPVITMIGNQFAYVVGGTMIMEILFSLPGVGRLTYESIVERDYTQLQGNLLFIAVVYVLVNLIVDVTYAWCDPRIRYR